MRRFDLKSSVVPLVLAAFLLPVLVLLLQGDALPCTHDNIFHSYRIVAMREMLRFGWLFSRWVPNLALGYGYPFFNYREPLPYLVGEAAFAIGTSLPLVLGGLYAGSLIAAAWGAYFLARDLFGERAGWVAGVGYGLAPYLLMDVLRRGNLPESIGLAMLPWLFVSVRRLILGKSRRSFLGTMLLLIALFLSHNISSLMLAPFLGVYVVLLAWLYGERKAWPYAFLAVGLAVLLTAWFWLPALTEQDMVQLHLSRLTRNNDFHYNFVTWREMLFSLPAPYDPDYLNRPMRISLGVVQAGLAVVGVVVGLARGRGREERWLAGFLLVAAALYLWAATPGSFVGGGAALVFRAVSVAPGGTRTAAGVPARRPGGRSDLRAVGDLSPALPRGGRGPEISLPSLCPSWGIKGEWGDLSPALPRGGRGRERGQPSLCPSWGPSLCPSWGIKGRRGAPSRTLPRGRRGREISLPSHCPPWGKKETKSPFQGKGVFGWAMAANGRRAGRGGGLGARGLARDVSTQGHVLGRSLPGSGGPLRAGARGLDRYGPGEQLFPDLGRRTSR